MFKVLVVEDELIIRKGLIASVDWEELNCEVAGEAADGKEGLQKILQLKPNIVLSDIKMPCMSGIEMVEKAKREHVFHTVFITSFADFEYAKKGIELQVSNYLLKPIDEDELKETIKNICERICAEKADKKREEFQETGIHQNYYVEKTMEFIRERYKEKVGIGDVCEILKVSKSYLSRILKKNLDLSFVDLLNQYRIKQAGVILETEEMKIYELADLLGFSDYKHFCAVFKKYNGISPGDYRRRKMIENGNKKSDDRFQPSDFS